MNMMNTNLLRVTLIATVYKVVATASNRANGTECELMYQQCGIFRMGG